MDRPVRSPRRGLDSSFGTITDACHSDVLIVCPSSHHKAISRHIRSGFPISSLRVDVFPYDHPHDRSIGTCGLLRQCSSHVQTDFVLLPVDFIPPPSLPLSALLDKFRADTVSDGAISTACWFESRLPMKGIAVGDWGSVYRPTPIVWEEKTGSLLYIDSPDDVDRNSEDIDIRMGLLTQ
jgi:translation initiation factor eIF-2B subunit gamma